MAKLILLCLAASVGCCWALGSRAAANPGLEVTIVAERLIASEADQSIAFAPAANMRLGEQIYYTLRVRNVSEQPIANAIIEHPIPRNTRYVGAAQGPAASISVSVDGGKNYGELRQLVMSTSPGATRRAAAEDCTHLRFRLRYPLLPGATALLRFRAEFR